MWSTYFIESTYCAADAVASQHWWGREAVIAISFSFSVKKQGVTIMTSNNQQVNGLLEINYLQYFIATCLLNSLFRSEYDLSQSTISSAL